jgi:hypothetical protein
MLTQAQKPPRTFGLALAIILSVIYFSILPLLYNGMIILVRRHFEEVARTCIATEADPNICPYFAGIDGLPNIDFWQVLLSIGFFGVAVLAWRGGSQSMRFLLMIAILGITLYNLVTALSIPPPDITQEISSSQQFDASIARVNVFGGLLVVAYVVWYVNRAPARAFYRGYYLPEPQLEQK